MTPLVVRVYKRRQSTRRDAESQQYLQRRDFRITTTGYTAAPKLGVESRLSKVGEYSIKKRLEELEAAKEGA